MSDSNEPTPEQIQQARREGFSDSVQHMDNDRQERLTQSYHRQESQRDAHRQSFRKDVLGSGDQ